MLGVLRANFVVLEGAGVVADCEAIGVYVNGYYIDAGAGPVVGARECGRDRAERLSFFGCYVFLAAGGCAPRGLVGVLRAGLYFDYNISNPVGVQGDDVGFARSESRVASHNGVPLMT